MAALLAVSGALWHWPSWTVKKTYLTFTAPASNSCFPEWNASVSHPRQSAFSKQTSGDKQQDMLLCRSIFQLVSPAQVAANISCSQQTCSTHLLVNVIQFSQHLIFVHHIQIYTVLSLTSPEITHFDR